jgi:hypothetical protein
VIKANKVAQLRTPDRQGRNGLAKGETLAETLAEQSKPSGRSVNLTVRSEIGPVLEARASVLRRGDTHADLEATKLEPQDTCWFRTHHHHWWSSLPRSWRQREAVGGTRQSRPTRSALYLRASTCMLSSSSMRCISA